MDIRVIVLLLSLCLMTSVAWGIEWPEDYYNPSPSGDDVVLPMPCGGAMAFRKVHVPNQGPLNDVAIVIGGDREENGYAEYAHPAYIAGSFDDGPSRRYYLLGKYEVNRLQYQAMDDDCPTASPETRLPQTQVTWLEVLVFSDAYTQWLRANAADQLPVDGNEMGFVRLPTGVEWEYAARGGSRVAPADFRERVFPMDDSLVHYVWFSGPNSANGKSHPIGLLKPNPVGLHDVLGNVDEMVLDPFQLNRLNRLHGQSGGFTVRGGHYLTREEAIRTAYRHEVPFYKKEVPVRRKTTGFRLAVVSPVISSRDRLRKIEEAWNDLGTLESSIPEGPGLSGKPLQDPVDELEVIAKAAPDPNMQKRLQGVQSSLREIQETLRASLLERDDQRRLAAKAALRLGAFLCQKIAADALWVDALEDRVEKWITDLGPNDPSTKRQQRRLLQNETVLADNLAYYAETVIGSVDLYHQPLLTSQKAALTEDLLAYQDDRHREIIPFVDEHMRHISDYRETSRVRRSEWLGGCKLTQQTVADGRPE